MKKIQLSIPQPCHENWDAMTPTQQGRFCNACAKEVIDFSAMSDSDVLQYFNRKQSENVCGRVWPDQLNRTIVALPERRKPWVLQYAAAALLLLFRPGNTYAQGQIKMPRPVGAVSSATPVQKSQPFPVKTISGTVQDEKGEPIPYASIKLAHTQVGTQADSMGKFSFEVNEPKGILHISATGFSEKMYSFDEVLNAPVVLSQSIVELDEVVINSYEFTRGKVMIAGSMLSCRVGGLNIRDTTDSIVKKVAKLFSSTIKVYPNPVARNSSFTITCNTKAPGAYTLQLADASGKAVLQQVVNMPASKHQLQIPVSSTWSAGMYFIQLVDAKGKRIATEKLVLQ